MSTAAATNTLHRHRLHHHHNHTNLPLFKPSSLLKSTSSTITTTTTFSLSSSTAATAAAASTSVSASISEGVISFDALQDHLSAQNFKEADEETRRLIIQLAGEAAVKRGYVFFSEVRFISDSDLKAIDNLWKTHSGNKFGYSVQRKIWKKVNMDFTKLFIKLGWMKKLDTEMEQYNYRAFPDEFIWELKDDTPEGHLPLTNALRGTQLFKCILTHPAFDDQEEEDKAAGEEDNNNGSVKKQSMMNDKRVFKTDYSF